MFAYCGNNPIDRKDPTGQFWVETVLSIVIIGTLFLSGCDSQNELISEHSNLISVSNPNYGAASSYSFSDSRKFNCYAYALGETQWKYVGGSSNAVENFDVDVVAQMVLEDARKDGRSMRIIDSYNSPIESNEYRVAMRTGIDDYHFMVQHSDGSWSHKPGRSKTRLSGAFNPSIIPWNAYYHKNFLWIEYEAGAVVNYYDSDTRYFAVSK